MLKVRYNIFAFYIALILLVSGLLYLYSRSYFDEGNDTMFVVAENRTVLSFARLSVLTPSGGTVYASGNRMVYHIDNGTFSMTNNVSILWDSDLATPRDNGKPNGKPNGEPNGEPNGKPNGKPNGEPNGNPPQRSYHLQTDTLDYREDMVFYLPNGGSIVVKDGSNANANVNVNSNANANVNSNANAGVPFVPEALSSNTIEIRIKPGELVFDPSSNIIRSDNAVLRVTSDNITLKSLGAAKVMYNLETGNMVVDGMSEVVEVATGNTLVSDKISLNSHRSTIEFLGNVSIKVQEGGGL